MSTITPQALDQVVELEAVDKIMTTNSSGITKVIPASTLKEFFAEVDATAAPAASAVKEVTLSNSDTSKPWLSDYSLASLPRSFMITITFAAANTYGDSEAATVTYPQIQIKNKAGTTLGTYQVCDSRGHTAGTGCWNANDIMTFKAVGTKLLIQNSDIRQVTSDYTILSDNTKEYSKTKIDSLLSNKTLEFISKQTMNTGNNTITISYGLYLLYSVDSNYGQCCYLVYSGYTQGTNIVTLVQTANFTLSVSSFHTLNFNNNTSSITLNISRISMKY